MKTTLKLVALLVLIAPLTSHALVDLRATYGVLPIKSQDSCEPNCPTAALGGIGADVIVSPPLFPIGIGARYEKQGATASVNSIDFDMQMERMALIVNYRLINTFLHFGPIFTYGISHKTSLKASFGGATVADYSSDKGDSYSLGLELGVKPLIVIPLMVGVEAGYLSYKGKDARDSVSGNTDDIDYSGTYMKAFLGIGF